MANIIVTPDERRGAFNRIADLVAAQLGISTGQFLQTYKMMPYVLKMAAYLSPGLSSYSLSPRKGVDQSGIPTQSLLDINDFFALTSMGIRIGRAAYASGIYSNWGNYVPFTFPDPNFFSGTGSAVGGEAASLNVLLNGTTAISVNNDSLIDGIVNQDLMFNPMSTYTSSPVAYPQFGGDDEGTKGYKPITPNLILDASADNSFNVNLAPGAKLNIDGAISTGTTDSGIRNVLYVVAQGWKIKNLAGSGVVLNRCA